MTNFSGSLNSKEQIKLYGLDHLRALAILLVLGFHYQLSFFGHPGWLQTVAKGGWTGVDLFFVLSGFLIASQLFSQLKKSKTFSLRHFFLKRFFRIIPVYLFIVGIYFCVPFFHEREALPPLWKFLTFTQNLGLDVKTKGTFSHAWSLCVEEHFYFFLPLLLILLQFTNFFKKSYWILIVFFLLGFVVRMYSWNTFYHPKMADDNASVYWAEYIYYPTYTRLDGLLVGVSIAALSQYRPKAWHKISRFGNHLIFISLLVLAGTCFLFTEPDSYGVSIFGFPLIAVGFGFLVMGAISPTSFLYKWNSKTTTLIATLSYAVYLSHKGIIHMVQQLFSNLGIDKNGNMMLLICFGFCILVALLLNIIIEKPFMKWRDRIMRQKAKVSNTSIAAKEPVL